MKKNVKANYLINLSWIWSLSTVPMMALFELKKILKINLLIFLYSRSSERAERACQTSYAPPRKNITFLTKLFITIGSLFFFLWYLNFDISINFPILSNIFYFAPFHPSHSILHSPKNPTSPPRTSADTNDYHSGQGWKGKIIYSPHYFLFGLVTLLLFLFGDIFIYFASWSTRLDPNSINCFP
jgi:hypothetical protein